MSETSCHQATEAETLCGGSQGDMSLDDLRQQLAAEGILRECPQEAFKDCVGSINVGPLQPDELPLLIDVKQALISDVALPLSCQELNDRCILAQSELYSAMLRKVKMLSQNSSLKLSYQSMCQATYSQ